MNDTMQEPTVATQHDVRMLRSRASSLTQQAKSLPEPLATTYRRRARELALEAYVIEQSSVR